MGLPAGESRSFPSGPATPGAKARESGRRFSSSGEDQRRSSSAPSLLGPDGTALARAANPVRGPAGAAYFALLALLRQAVSLPLDYWEGYRLAHQVGLSDETRAGWLLDQAKGALLLLLLGCPAAGGPAGGPAPL